MKILMAENLVWNDSVRVGSHHIARQFLDHGHELFWISLPWTPAHLIGGLKSERIRQWNWGTPLRPEHNLWTWCPLTPLPYRNHLILRNYGLGRTLLRRSLPSVRSVLKAAGFSKVDLLWMTDPRMLSIRELVDFRASAYRCVDQMNAFSDVPPSVDKLERELVGSSTVVFATAEDLLNKLREWRQDLEFLPNAADIDHFRVPAPEPQPLKAIARPRVLYVGALGEWFDTELLRAMAERMPDVSFVIVGPKRRSLHEIEGVSNILLLGPQPYTSIPGYMQHCDVAIIPFTASALSRAVNPIKLYEYLAAGVPVVCSDLPEVTRSGLPVRIATGAEQFEAAIREAFRLNAGERTGLAQSVEKYSWKSRFEQVAATLKSRSSLELITA